MSVAPESAGRTKLLVAPVTVVASVGTNTTVAWPVPVATWQLRQLHSNMESARPLMESVTAPQSQVAERSRSRGDWLMRRRLARERGMGKRWLAIPAA